MKAKLTALLLACAMLCSCGKASSASSPAGTSDTAPAGSSSAAAASDTGVSSVGEEPAVSAESKTGSDSGEVGEPIDSFEAKIYTEPGTEAFQSLGTECTVLDGTYDADTTVRFTVSPDDVIVTLSWGEWDTLYNVFHPITEIFSLETKAGTVYEFPAQLAETIPEYCLHIESGWNSADWYLTYDGKGEGGVIDLLPTTWEPELPDEGTPILSSVQAYAGWLFRAGDMEALETDSAWKAIGNAAMLYTLRYADADEEGTVRLTDWQIEGYREAMFPANGSEPGEGDPVSYEPDHYERYAIRDAIVFDDSTSKIESMTMDNGGQITVTVDVTDGNATGTVLVYLQYEPYCLFNYYISDASVAKG